MFDLKNNIPQILSSSENASERVNKVSGMLSYIDVGAGDPDLLSVKAHRLISIADIVAYDTGVSPAILAVANPAAGRMGIERTGAAFPSAGVLAQLRPGQTAVYLLETDAVRRGPAAVASTIRAGHSSEFVPGAMLPGVQGAIRPVHRPAILFLTGLSGAGKSTLASGLEERLVNRGVLATVVDGDILRTGLSSNLGYTSEDRQENIRRASELALHLAAVGAVVIVALISPFRADRAAAAERARARGISFAEVFINAPLAVCELRDPKKLYQRARAGQIKYFTGIDSPYEEPLAPTLELHTDRETVDESMNKLTALALGLCFAPPAAGNNAA